MASASPFGRWCDRQVAYFERVPSWLVGTILFGCLGLVVSWAVADDSWAARVVGATSTKQDPLAAGLVGLYATMPPAAIALALVGRLFPSRIKSLRSQVRK